MKNKRLTVKQWMSLDPHERYNIRRSNFDNASHVIKLLNIYLDTGDHTNIRIALIYMNNLVIKDEAYQRYLHY